MTTELHGTEIDEVEQIGHVNMVEVHLQGVGCAFRGNTVYTYALIATGDKEVVDFKMVFAIDDVGRMDGEGAVANAHFRGTDIYMRLGHAIVASMKSYHRVEASFKSLNSSMVIQGEHRHELVVFGGSLEAIVCSNAV
ncbi:MAG: hypothetical protein M0P33_10420 [Massilibacteroides sp.]|nr:hypothetical protein [Massilibacteroides sp.]